MVEIEGTVAPTIDHEDDDDLNELRSKKLALIGLQTLGQAFLATSGRMNDAKHLRKVPRVWSLDVSRKVALKKLGHFSCLRTSLGPLIHGPLGFAPKGLQDSAQGFNPGSPPSVWFALKGERCGYEMNLAAMAAQKLQWVVETCYNCAIGPISTLLGRPIWRPFRARRVGWSVPRVETLG
jgi:hypothetical protein